MIRRLFFTCSSLLLVVMREVKASSKVELIDPCGRFDGRFEDPTVFLVASVVLLHVLLETIFLSPFAS